MIEHLGAEAKEETMGKSNGYTPAIWEKITVVTVSVGIVLLVGWLVLRNQKFVDPNLVVILRIIISLAVAVLGATIPGFLQVDMKGKGLAIRAGGALALFIVTYLLSPSVVQEKPPEQEKPPGDKINNVNRNEVQVTINNSPPLDQWNQIRKMIQDNGAKGPREHYKRPEDNLDEMAKSLDNYRKLPLEKLTDEDKAKCMYMAGVLKLNGRDVPDLERWLGADLVDSVEQNVRSIIGPTKNAVSDALNQSASILVAADLRFSNRKFAQAIDLYKRYLTLIELTPAFSSADVFSTDDKSEVIFKAKEELGIAYMEEAENLIQQGQRVMGEEMRGEAFKIYADLAKAKKGAQVVIVPDKKNHPDGWYIHAKTGIPGVSVVREDGDRYAIRMTNQDSSFLAAQLVEVNSPSDYRLKWRWKLMKTSPGYRDKDTGFSANHPLSVTVAFLTTENRIIAIHYVIDPLEPVGKLWVDKEVGGIQIGVLKFELIYPHVVVADSKFPLGEWQDCEVNPAEDYKQFAQKDPSKFGTGVVPAIRGIVVESNCQFREPNAPKNSVEGEIAGLRLERIAKSEPSKPGP